MATHNNDNRQAIIDAWIHEVESNPDLYPTPKDSADLLRMNQQALRESIEEKDPGYSRRLLEELLKNNHADVDSASLTHFDDEALLRLAVTKALQHPKSALNELAHIHAAFIDGRPQWAQLWETLTAQPHARASFHLEGDAITDHSVDSTLLTSLITGITEATQATGKARADEKKATAPQSQKPAPIQGGNPLRVLAMQPGSFEFSLETTPIASDEEGQLADGGVPHESIDDIALRDVIDVLYSDGNDKSLEVIPATARQKLLPAAEAFATHGLTISTHFTQRHRTATHRVTRPTDAISLVNRLREPHTSTTDIRAILQLDGYRQSEQAAYLIIDGRSRRVSVDNDQLFFSLVAMPVKDKGTWIDAAVEKSVTRQAGKKPNTEFRLISANEAEPPAEVVQIPLFEGDQE